MVIIQCPNCERRFNLRKVPKGNFKCPKCHYSSPFSEVLPSTTSGKKEIVTQTGDSGVNPNQETKLVKELQEYDSGGASPISIDSNKTVVIQELQQHFYFRIYFEGNVINKLDISRLADGVYSIGRNSSDSTAQIKLSPDINMSRTHAYMKISRANNVFNVMVQPGKATNPLLINGNAIPMGKHAILRIGDWLTMGQTKIVFSNN